MIRDILAQVWIVGMASEILFAQRVSAGNGRQDSGWFLVHNMQVNFTEFFWIKKVPLYVPSATVVGVLLCKNVSLSIQIYSVFTSLFIYNTVYSLQHVFQITQPTKTDRIGREYLMIYRGPGFLARMIWILALFLSYSASCLRRTLTELCRNCLLQVQG